MNNSNLVGYIKLKKIQEYNNIKASLFNITSSYFFRNYNLDINEFKDIVKKKNIEIFKELNEIESKLLEELLKYTKREEYNKCFIESTTLEVKKKILNYMYWQYKLIDTSIKIDLSDLKRILKIKNATKYIEPMQVYTECKICGKESTIFINSYNNNEDILFKCNNCKHEEMRHKEYIFPIKCECERCKKLNNNFFDTVKNNFNNLVEGIEEQAEEFYNKAEVEEIVDREMEMDYKIYRSEMKRDIREIMSYNPKDKKELLILIHKLSERNEMYNKKYKDEITEKLFKLRIIYKVREKENLNVMKSEVVNRFIHEYYGNTDNPIEVILHFLNECNTLQQFKDVVKYINDRMCFEIGGKKYDFLLDGDMMCASSYDPRYKDSIIINKYYFMNSSLKHSYDRKHLSNIFNSEKEKSIYIMLKNEYNRFIVYPNCKADSIIDTEKIQKYINEEEYNYLKNCYFNFVILDLDGNPLKIIQLQKGKHHNEKQWIKKDNIKRKICEFTGIEFEEMY